MTSETFDHRLRINEIRDGDRVDLVANDAECAAIAQRIGIERLDRLDAHAAVSKDGPVVRATGRVAASLCQACVVTGEPVTSHVDEPFDIRFLPEPGDGQPDEEVELGSDECDIVFHDGATIDLGAAIADTLALTIDPYPRSAGADAALKEAGIMTEEEASPFAALAALKLDRDKP